MVQTLVTKIKQRISKTSPIKFEGSRKKELMGFVILHSESCQKMASQWINFEHDVHSTAGKTDAMLAQSLYYKVRYTLKAFIHMQEDLTDYTTKNAITLTKP